jgi:hypothetical protein
MAASSLSINVQSMLAAFTLRAKTKVQHCFLRCYNILKKDLAAEGDCCMIFYVPSISLASEGWRWKQRTMYVVWVFVQVISLYQIPLR